MNQIGITQPPRFIDQEDSSSSTYSILVGNNLITYLLMVEKVACPAGRETKITVSCPSCFIGQIEGTF